jgi:hypothetical protein
MNILLMDKKMQEQCNYYINIQIVNKIKKYIM